MKKLLSFALVFAMLFLFSSCSGNTENTVPNTTANTTKAQQTESTENNTSVNSKTLVVFFSRTGENYGVGNIEKGNTHIIADMIAKETNADMFEITTVNQYPEAYDECTEVAKQEKDDNARPEIIGTVENMAQYDTVFIGYPIWWSDMPMAVYTFLESYDFSGKTIIPFCTNEGTGLSGTPNNIQNTCPSATVITEGFEIRGRDAQNSQDQAKEQVQNWLNKIDK